MDNEITTYLTPEDIAAVRDEMSRKYRDLGLPPTEAEISRRLRKIAWGIRREFESAYGQPHGIKWAALVASLLTDYDFDPHLRGVNSLDKLRELYEAWTNETVAFPEWVDNGRRWLNSTRYQMWRLIDDVEEWARDAAADECFDMAIEQEDGKSIARSIRARLAKRVADLESQYGQKREVAA